MWVFGWRCKGRWRCVDDRITIKRSSHVCVGEYVHTEVEVKAERPLVMRGQAGQVEVVEARTPLSCGGGCSGQG